MIVVAAGAVDDGGNGGDGGGNGDNNKRDRVCNGKNLVDATTTPAARLGVIRGQVNIGGLPGRDPDYARSWNLNTEAGSEFYDEAVQTGDLKGAGENIANCFIAGSVTRLVSHRLPPATVSWNALAQGAYAVMRPGGEIDILKSDGVCLEKLQQPPQLGLSALFDGKMKVLCRNGSDQVS